MYKENWLSGNTGAGFGRLALTKQWVNAEVDFGARTATKPGLYAESCQPWRTLFHDIVVMVGMELMELRRRV